MNLEWNGRNAEEESQDPLGVVRREEDLHFPVSLIVGDTKVVLVDEDMLRIDRYWEKENHVEDHVEDPSRWSSSTWLISSCDITSHEMSDDNEQYCNTVGILHDGKLVEMGRLDDMKKK